MKKNCLKSDRIKKKAVLLHRKKADSVAQQVEHNTFNVGVLGSSPSRVTKTENQPVTADFLVYGARKSHTLLQCAAFKKLYSLP